MIYGRDVGIQASRKVEFSQTINMSSADPEKDGIASDATPTNGSSIGESPKEVVDPNIVDFDGPDDPEDPFNWSPRYKWITVITLSMMSLMV